MTYQKVFVGSALVALSFMGTTALAQKQDVKAIQSEIQTTYKKVVVAYRNHDLKAYSDTLTPAVRVVNPDGKIQDHKANLAFTKDDMAMTGKIRSGKLVFHKSMVHGNELISDVTIVWDNDLIDTKGEYGPKGKIYPIIWKQRGIHTHVKRGHDWLLKRLEWKEEPNITSGGKPLVPLAQKKK